MMKNICSSLVFIFVAAQLKAQNYNLYIMYKDKDTVCYNACKLYENINSRYYQYTKEYQLGMDEVLSICPTFADAYAAKSVAYLKSGDFITWKLLIDKAVELDEVENIGYRAGCRFDFFADYLGALNDITRLETLKKEIGSTADGEMHLKTVKALSQHFLGQNSEAITTLSKHLETYQYNDGLFDRFYLGLLYLHESDYKKALENFTIHEKNNPLAEISFYKAKYLWESTKDKNALELLNNATDLLKNNRRLLDDYSFMPYSIGTDDIEELRKILKYYGLKVHRFWLRMEFACLGLNRLEV